MIEYTSVAPTSFQRDCPHQLLNRAQTECASCASKRSAVGAPWEYLTVEWIHYYRNGGERPDA